MTPTDVLKLIKEKEATYCDLRFADTRGKEQHVTVGALLRVDQAHVDHRRHFSLRIYLATDRSNPLGTACCILRLNITLDVG